MLSFATSSVLVFCSTVRRRHDVDVIHIRLPHRHSQHVHRGQARNQYHARRRARQRKAEQDFRSRQNLGSRVDNRSFQARDLRDGNRRLTAEGHKHLDWPR